MLEQLKIWLRRSPALESVAYLIHNNLLWPLNFSGTSLRDLSPEQGTIYVRTVAERYRHAARQHNRSLEGAKILEIGPGDNLGVALYLIGWGAREVVCIDRFDCLGSLHTSRRLYQHLLSTLSSEERKRITDLCPWCFDPSAGPPSGAVTFLPGVELERCDEALGGTVFDCIFSNAALEHISDLRRGIAAVSRLLASNGWMFHEVDFRSHNRFDTIGPLHFLTLDARLWRAMTSRVGSPNRLRINTYRHAFAAAGLTCEEEVIASVSPEHAQEVFPHVDPSVSVERPEDLLPLIARFVVYRSASRNSDQQ